MDEAAFAAADDQDWIDGIWVERMDWFDQFARVRILRRDKETSQPGKPAVDVIRLWFSR